MIKYNMFSYKSLIMHTIMIKYTSLLLSLIRLSSISLRWISYSVDNSRLTPLMKNITIVYLVKNIKKNVIIIL